MRFTVTFDATKLNRKLLEYAAVTKMDTKKAVHQEMGLLIKRCIELTAPPHGKGGKGNAKRLGEKAIETDLGRIFVGIDRAAVKSFEDKFGNRFVQGEFIGKAGVYGTESLIFDSTGSGIEPHHQSYRRKDGRVTFAGTETKDIGRWKFINKMYVDKGDLKKYLRSVQARVGTAKAGWMKAAKFFGSKGTPAWVSRHSDQDGYTNVTENGDKIVMFGINRNKAIGSLNQRSRIVQNAMIGRLRDLTTKLNGVLKRGAKKFNRK